MYTARTVKFMAMVMVLIMTFGTVASAMAASTKGERVRLMGTVTVIDLKNENFSIADRNKNTTKIFVNPSTEFEITVDRDNLSEDEARFDSLRIGDWVRVKAYRVNNELEASEVDVYRAP